MRRMNLRLALVVAAAISASSVGSCVDSNERLSQSSGRIYPPSPQSPRVVALGNLRSGLGASESERQLAIILFGEEPEPPMSFVRPLSVSNDLNGLLTCDAALGMVLRWDQPSRALCALEISPRPSRPVAAIAMPDGDWLIADGGGSGAVLRFSPSGRLIRQYGVRDRPYRPAGMLVVGDELWVSNVLGHRIEVFETATGDHLRSFGERGAGDGQFGMPLGLAQTPTGDICVVDQLNSRVQILSPDGIYVSKVGGPGDIVGTFGRPKGVAVGDDGVMFVTDAASQRVHCFDSRGQPLMAFGEPGTGLGALSVPGGVCVTRECPIEDALLPEGFTAEYFVLVAEQLLRPGIRVYAWGGSSSVAGGERSVEPTGSSSAGAGETINPHWSAGDCRTCHSPSGGGAPRAIPAADVDTVCLSCHDGKKARAEAHPVGRLALTRDIQPPDDWPLNDGRLGCLTCHDIRRHCSKDAVRPLQNASMLRVFEVDQPLALCTQCHKPAESWRISPHKNLAADGGVIEQSCLFCHSRTPAIPGDGKRRGEPMLHSASSKLCLTCHTRHWDVSPIGHVDRPASQEIQDVLAAGSGQLPLSDAKVTCYSCHNPHEAGLFPSGSPLGAVSQLATDVHAALRVTSVELCLECHAK